MIHTPIVVKMQLLVNYHKNKEERYWKFKGGDTIVVYNCEKVADAVSFANKIFGNNKEGSQRFPVSWSTLDEYLKETTAEAGFDAWYVDHLINTISCISPEPEDNSISSSYIRNVKGWKKLILVVIVFTLQILKKLQYQ